MTRPTELRLPRGNITLPGEKETADELASLYARYIELSGRYFAMPSGDSEGRTRLYFSQHHKLLFTIDIN